MAKADKQETSMTTAGSSPFGVMERPDFLKVGDTRGTEDLNIATDVRPPSLKLAQGQTPQTKKIDAKYIEGLEEGQFFNPLTRRIYGQGPIWMVVVKALGHRNVELRPLNEGGGVIDFDVADGDGRAQFSTIIKDGKKIRVKPVATRFFDYVVMVLHENGEHETMAMSLKGAQIAKAVTMNSLVVGGKLASFAYLWKVEAVAENKHGFNYWGWKITQAGYPSREVYDVAEKTYDALKGKDIEIDRESEAADEDEFATGDKVPF